MLNIPTRDEAETYLKWAENENPGLWTDHSRVVAKSAEKIAEKCGLNSDVAYVLGLLHDIGRYKGVTSTRHIYDGYKFMMEEDFEQVAQICMTHSFPIKDFRMYAGGTNDCNEAETNEMIEFLLNVIYTEYDLLIQLCDSLADVKGICLMEKRLMNVAMRYGVKSYSEIYWKKMFELRDYFSEKIGQSIYTLFPEVKEITFL